jgi:hypothetical protein
MGSLPGFTSAVAPAADPELARGLATAIEAQSRWGGSFSEDEQLQELAPGLYRQDQPRQSQQNYPVQPPCATGSGCPHFTTYDGLHFDFQGAGEFIAARSTLPGNNFQVQMRIEPEGNADSAVSIITQIAVQVGNNRITFGMPQGSDLPRPQVVWLDGAPVPISQTSPVFTLAGGSITEVSSNEFRVALNTGEVVTVNPFGDGMGLNITLSPTDGPGSVQGFFGAYEGQANDFQLPTGRCCSSR